MIPSFSKTRIGLRLGIAFGGLLFVMSVLAGAALLRMTAIGHNVEQVLDQNARKADRLHAMRSAVLDESVAVRNIMLETMDEEKKRHADVIQHARENYKHAAEALAGFALEGEDRQLLGALSASRTGVNEAIDKAIAFAMDGHQAEGIVYTNRRAQPQQEKLLQGIDKLIAAQDAASAAARTAADASRRTASFITLGLALIAVTIGALLAIVITRGITRPIGEAVDAAEAIAKGRLDRRMQTHHGGEVGQLMRAMATVSATMAHFAEALSELAQRHEQGFVSARVPADEFEGTYREVAEQINALLSTEVDMTMRLVDVASRYAAGDFSVDMDRLPGETAVLTDTMDRVKANLQAMNGEILTLVSAAKQGDLAQRGNAERFEHGFRDMVEGINQTLDAIVAPVSDVSRVLGALAAGDLSARITNSYSGAFETLANDTNTSVAQLTTIIRGIKQSADSISNAAGEIASGNANLADRTAQQAANLEETASSMEELTATVKQNADSARRANELAHGAASVAGHGGQVVEQVVATMASIETSSKKIVDIIGVIDGIAFQTNILALNAAVEAARAGEQGRGFAVVASEVRNLAQRSANAAKEIKTLIGDSVERVNGGSKLVAQAGKTMSDIVASVNHVTGIIGEISDASQQQRAGIEQVNTTVTQMDEGTQQNAALVEEASAAARSLEEQALALASAVARFKIADEAQRPLLEVVPRRTSPQKLDRVVA